MENNTVMEMKRHSNVNEKGIRLDTVNTYKKYIV